MFSLNENLIHKYADKQSFARGKDYFSTGEIFEPFRHENLLGGFCTGSQFVSYKVEVMLDEEDIRKATCTCPRGGFCKHIVALLLTYLHEPEKFYNLEELRYKLIHTEKDELIKLIMDMVKKDNSILGKVDRQISLSVSSGAEVENIHRQIQRSMCTRSFEDVVEAGYDFVYKAKERSNQEDWVSAGIIYAEVLNSISTVYDDELWQLDDYGELAALSSDCVKGLNNCLVNYSDDKTRRKDWLEALLEAGLLDIEHGGIGLAEDSFKVILEHALDDEWDDIEQRIKSVIPEEDRWSRECLVGILAEWYSNLGQEKEAASIIHEMGTTEQIAFQLVREKQFNRAIQIAREQLAEKPGIITRFADYLVAFGASSYAVNLLRDIMDAEQGRVYGSYIEWMAKYYLKKSELQEALNWQWKLFELWPGKNNYVLLQEIGTKLDNWEKLRLEAIEFLERKEKIAELLEIALYECNWSRALELLPRVKSIGWTDYRLKVAWAIENDRPKDAIELYKEIVKSCINWRNRGSYRQAAAHLSKVRKLYKRLGEIEEWEKYIAHLKNEYARLPALQDELRKATL